MRTAHLPRRSRQHEQQARWKRWWQQGRWGRRQGKRQPCTNQRTTTTGLPGDGGIGAGRDGCGGDACSCIPPAPAGCQAGCVPQDRLTGHAACHTAHHAARLPVCPSLAPAHAAHTLLPYAVRPPHPPQHTHLPSSSSSSSSSTVPTTPFSPTTPCPAAARRQGPRRRPGQQAPRRHDCPHRLAAHRR